MACDLHQATIGANADLSSSWPLGTVDIQLKYKKIVSRKYIYKWRLQHGGYFVLVS